MSSLDQDCRVACLEETGILSIVRQAELLEVSRKCIYRKEDNDTSDQIILNTIDKIYTDSPYFGQRRIKITLFRDYHIQAGRWTIRMAMRILGIEAMYPKKNTSIPDSAHKKYPYLLKGLKIVRINQVWGCDITYIRLEHGFIYLVAIIDWYSRKVLSWKLSTTLDTYFCIECLNEAVEIYGKPEIFNTDQ